MRATEILNEVTRPDDRWIASEILSRSGWHVLGAGSFGSVYDKEGVSYVLKLFDADDTAYRAFLSLIQQHPNPHFPKIIGKPMAVSKTVYAVRMEKLSRFRGMADLYAHYVRFRDDTNMDPNGWAANKMSDAEEMFYDQPDLKVALDLIHDLVKRFQPDISPDNVMMRGSTVVFIDPVCNVRDGKERHIMSVPWREPPPPPPKPMSKRMQDILDDDALMRELMGESREARLTPAIRYNGRIYKGKEHGLIRMRIPDLVDIEDNPNEANAQFGFINDRGHWMERDQAMEYARNNGLLNGDVTPSPVLTADMLKK